MGRVQIRLFGWEKHRLVSSFVTEVGVGRKFMISVVCRSRLVCCSRLLVKEEGFDLDRHVMPMNWTISLFYTKSMMRKNVVSGDEWRYLWMRSVPLSVENGWLVQLIICSLIPSVGETSEKSFRRLVLKIELTTVMHISGKHWADCSAAISYLSGYNQRVKISEGTQLDELICSPVEIAVPLRSYWRLVSFHHLHLSEWTLV